MHRYALGKKLGEGAFGDVRLAKHRETGEKVAIKTFKEKCPRMDNLLMQPEALRALSHPNIVQCKEYLFEEGRSRAHLVFELMDMGSLERYCRHRKSPFSDYEVRSIFYQVLLAVEHMHSLNYIHRDIKPENILLKAGPAKNRHSYPIVKLADLGLAKNIGNRNERPKTTYVATRWYRSPEILLRLRDYGEPSDIWAVGAVLAEVVAMGTPLFPGNNEDDQLRRVVALRGHPACVGWENGSHALKGRCNVPYVMPSSLRQYVPDASEPVLQLIEDMLEMDPLARPTAREALHSAIFLPSPKDSMTSRSFESYANVRTKCNSKALDPQGFTHLVHGTVYKDNYDEMLMDNERKIPSVPFVDSAVRSNNIPSCREKVSTFYIPPLSEENGLVYKSKPCLRSPAGSFNVAPKN